ncbi:MAG: RNase adapter RapZ [Planctomycetales bacterium]|nr:RNase adapter RapZ [bacterium]UNM07748.1 MAG: RNase adapter RapZ [Planctomycetales bacterium]
MDEAKARLVIVTGMSGAGKSTALRCFEDLGYFCLDNIPPRLIEMLLLLSEQAQAGLQGIAIVCDVRSGTMFDDVSEVVEKLSADDRPLDIIYIDCDDDVLVNRFKEARRVPPLGAESGIEKAIAMERQKLDALKQLATVTIDTSSLSPSQLRNRVLAMYSEDSEGKRFIVTLISFGFKYGVPPDADFVFDTRIIPNPFYVAGLRNLTGNDKPVFEYVMQHDQAVQLAGQIKEMMEHVIPRYPDVHKYNLVVAIGCTGGKHRSVSIVNHLAENLKGDGRRISIQHRDMEKL